MFGRRYFGSRAFGRRYFGGGSSTPVVNGAYNGARYFGPRYFGPRYFSTVPGVPAVGTAAMAALLDSVSASMSAGAYPAAILAGALDSVSASIAAGGPVTHGTLFGNRYFGSKFFGARYFGPVPAPYVATVSLVGTLDSVAGSMSAGSGGVLGRDIPATGEHGPALAYPTYALDPVANDDARYVVIVLTLPASGTLTVYADTSFDLVGAADGVWTFQIEVFRDGVSLGPATATATVGDNIAPTITVQPAAVAVAPGATATLSVFSGGTPPLAYQWFRGVAAISGATASIYTTPAAISADDGAQYSVRVTNAWGVDTSLGATLSVVDDAPLTDLEVRRQFNMIREIWQALGLDRAAPVTNDNAGNQQRFGPVVLSVLTDSAGTTTVARQ